MIMVAEQPVLLKHGSYGERWFKIRNTRYSRYEGRRELFEKKRAVATSAEERVLKYWQTRNLRGRRRNYLIG